MFKECRKMKIFSLLIATLILLSVFIFSAVTVFAYAGTNTEIAEYSESYAGTEENSNDGEDTEEFLLDAPVLSSASYSSTGITISWKAVEGAEKYRVYYKISGGNWSEIADTELTGYTWSGASLGTNYTFTVRCVTADGKSYMSSYDDAGISFTALLNPQLSSVENVATGVKVSWGKVSGAEKYRVYYKISGGSWTKIADTTSTSYTWTEAKSNTKYTFTVRCLTSDSMSFTSGYDSTGKTITYIEAPKLSSVEANNSGITIKWAKSVGAAKYRVYYKTASDSWTKIADTTSTEYTWTGAKIGTKYSYTVRCITGDGKSHTSGYDGTGLSLTAVAKPKLSSVENAETGVKVSWDKVSDAEKYRVYYKTTGGSWTKIADTTSTSYTWAGAQSGTKYTFTVRCLTSDAKNFTSGFDTTGKTLTYIAAPKLSSVENTATGVKISWAKSAGAAKYRVYYKVSGGSWTKIADTASTSYTWTGAKSGTEYRFTVRCISSDGNSHTSGFDSTGLSIDYVAAPKLASVNAVSSGVQITWNKTVGAEKYRVYYKVGSGEWNKLADTADTSYTLTGADFGTKYTFTVRCISDDGSRPTSSYDSTGLSLTYVSIPQITSVENAATGVQVNWGKVSGAEKYRVYYKVGSGAWTKIAETTSTSYTWTGAKSATKYTFTVRCISSDNKSFTSDFDHTGIAITYIEAPQLTSVDAVASGIRITWNKSAGADQYRLYYKAGSGSWTKITDTTSTAYTWTGAKTGTKYSFTVRCISSDGSMHTSSFDSKGLGITYVSIPKISSAYSTASGVQISWGNVSGAEKYRVYYKNSSGEWVKITDTTSTSYTWSGAKNNTKYTFTVRCFSSDLKRYASYYDTVGYSMTYTVTLNAKANAAAEKYSNCTRYVYGTSAMGYQLEAYIIKGNGSNNRIIFMDFAVHGFEDEYAKDGKVLVTLGNGLVEYYSAHPELLGNYMLVIVPCANPDGTMFGKNNYRADKSNAFGRCTYKGVDMNRDFMSGHFKATESVALRSLMNKYKPNIYLNFHGWLDTVLGNPQLVSIFRSNVGLSGDQSNQYGESSGYIIGYVKNNYGAKAALVEFKNSGSVSQTKVINSINKIISNKL